MVFSCTHYLVDDPRAFRVSTTFECFDFEHSREFYVESLFVEVGDRVFDIPRTLYEAGSELAPLLIPRPREQQGVGWSEDRPVILTDFYFRQSEFISFLWYLCADWMICSSYKSSRPSGKWRTPIEPEVQGYSPVKSKKLKVSKPKVDSSWASRVLSYWEPILKVSTVLGFRHIRETAIKKISEAINKYDTLKQIELGREYKVREWLITGFTTLAKKDMTIDDKEMEILGVMTAVRLLRLRDKSFPKTESLETAISKEVDTDLGSPGHIPDMNKLQGMSHASALNSSLRRTPFHSTCCFRYVTLKVEDVLFRLPNAFLTDGSVVFHEMFTLLRTSNTEGRMDRNPIVLKQISLVDFKAFLHAIWPEDIGCNPIQSLEYWTSVLKLSTMWLFEHVRDRAIKEMTPMLAKDDLALKKLELGRRYDVHKWEMEVYLGLANRHAPGLSVEERRALGPEAVLPLLELRDISVRVKKPNGSSQGYQLTQVTMAEVEKKFSSNI